MKTFLEYDIVADCGLSFKAIFNKKFKILRMLMIKYDIATLYGLSNYYKYAKRVMSW